MFEAYTATAVNYTLNDLVNFNNTKYSDCRVRFTNSNTFTINAPGRYFIYFNGVAASSTAATPFSVQLFNNDVAIPETSTEITSTAANDAQNMSFGTIVNVLPSNCFIDNTVRLQVRVISEVEGTINNTNIVIFRLK